MNENKIISTIKAKIALTISKASDPKSFFVNRKGLYVWSDFSSRITNKTEPVEAGKTFPLSSFALTKSASDADIESSLPQSHTFSESEVCAIIAELITRQPAGENGELLTTGYVNLFYTPSFVVDVHWVAGGGGWRVLAWNRGGDEWGQGRRVFSPATDHSESLGSSVTLTLESAIEMVKEAGYKIFKEI